MIADLTKKHIFDLHFRKKFTNEKKETEKLVVEGEQSEEK
jgi:hypothetical protein